MKKIIRVRIGKSSGSYRAQSSAKTMDRILVIRYEDMFLYTRVRSVWLTIFSKGRSDQLMVGVVEGMQRSLFKGK